MSPKTLPAQLFVYFHKDLSCSAVLIHGVKGSEEFNESLKMFWKETPSTENLKSKDVYSKFKWHNKKLQKNVLTRNYNQSSKLKKIVTIISKHGISKFQFLKQKRE
jgi:hypothetical protein